MEFPDGRSNLDILSTDFRYFEQAVNHLTIAEPSGYYEAIDAIASSMVNRHDLDPEDRARRETILSLKMGGLLLDDLYKNISPIFTAEAEQEDAQKVRQIKEHLSLGEIKFRNLIEHPLSDRYSHWDRFYLYKANFYLGRFYQLQDDDVQAYDHYTRAIDDAMSLMDPSTPIRLKQKLYHSKPPALRQGFDDSSSLVDLMKQTLESGSMVFGDDVFSRLIASATKLQLDLPDEMFDYADLPTELEDIQSIQRQTLDSQLRQYLDGEIDDIKEDDVGRAIQSLVLYSDKIAYDSNNNVVKKLELARIGHYAAGLYLLKDGNSDSAALILENASKIYDEIGYTGLAAEAQACRAEMFLMEGLANDCAHAINKARSYFHQYFSTGLADPQILTSYKNFLTTNSELRASYGSYGIAGLDNDFRKYFANVSGISPMPNHAWTYAKYN